MRKMYFEPREGLPILLSSNNGNNYGIERDASTGKKQFEREDERVGSGNSLQINHLILKIFNAL